LKRVVTPRKEIILKIKSKKKDNLVPKKKRIDARKILAVGMIIVAVALTFVVIPALYNQKASTEKVYVANGIIEKGTTVSEKNLTTVEMGVYGMKGYFTEESKESLIGQITSVDILAGDVLTKEKLGGTSSETVKDVTKEGHTLITLPVPNSAAGVGSHLRAGDYVRIWQKVEDEYTESETMYLNPLLAKVRVFSAENNDGTETKSASEKGEETAVSVVTFESTSAEMSQALASVVVSEGLHLEIVERSEE